MFKPHLNKVTSAFYEARHNVKKRIFTETNINKQWNKEANANENKNISALVNIVQEYDSNIFELLQNLWINNIRFTILECSRFCLLLSFPRHFYWVQKCS